MCNTTKFNERSTLTDFSKNAILNCYRAILNYLHDADVQKEECILKLFSELEVNRICIPKDIFLMINRYVEKHIAPIVYDRQTTFSLSNHEDDLLEMEQNSAKKMFSIEEKIVINFGLTMSDIEKELEIFAMTNLYPLLTGDFPK